MAHTNSTTNYGLPQFLPTDKPAWLVDINPAYAAIDTAIKNAADAAGDAQEDATQALSDAAGANAIATQANSKADGAIASISEQFLDTATYAVGEYVIFNNILYVCTEPVTTPGPWTGSVNWTRASVDSIATNVDSRIADINTAIGEINTELSGKSNTLVVERRTVSIVFSNANYAFTNADISKAGYTPIGIVGTQTQSIGFYFFRANLTAIGSNNAVIGLASRSGDNATMNIDTFIDILYVKN